jgi:hypothetical protein
MLEHGYRTRSTVVFHFRKAQGFRDAACSCMDASCARRVRTALEAYGESIQDDTSPLDAEQEAELAQIFFETKRCIDAPITRQAVDELDAIRAASCACDGPDCAAEQRAAYREWEETYATYRSTDQTGIDRIQEIADAIVGCWADAEAP